MTRMNREGVLVIGEERLRGEPQDFPVLEPWEWRVASTPQRAQQMLAAYPFRIGVFDFRHTDRTLPLAGWREEILRANSQIHWLAVVPPGLLTDSRVADLLSTRFFAYQTEPIEAPRFAMLLETAANMAKLRLEHRGSSQEGWLRGESAAMQRLDLQLTRAARAGLPILIGGEVGSGKGAAARIIHERSPRRHQAFRLIRSITLPGCLLTSIPAVPDRRNVNIEAGIDEAMSQAAANGGTLVLDEVGDLSEVAQRVLLRWLEAAQGQIQFIAITHMDLMQAVAEQRFRADLLHRLSALHLTMPPLRERGDDLLLLAEHFVKADWALNRHVTRLSRPAINAMRRHHWPGNVRELKSRIRQAMLLSDDYLLHVEDLGLPRSAGAVPGGHRTAATR